MNTPIKPLDPDSERGRQLAADLTVALDDVEAAIEERRRRKTTRERAA